MTKEEILSKHFFDDQLIEYRQVILDAMEEYANLSLSEQKEKHDKEIKDLKICTGCGKLNIEDIGKFVACCPDNKYIPIKEYWFHSTYLNK